MLWQRFTKLVSDWGQSETVDRGSNHTPVLIFVPPRDSEIMHCRPEAKCCDASFVFPL